MDRDHHAWSDTVTVGRPGAWHHVSLLSGVELVNWVEDCFPDFNEGRVDAHRSPIPQRPDAHCARIALCDFLGGQVFPISML
jgi:hypothetical protein